MSYTDQLGALEYEAEATWGENVNTFATHRIHILDPIDPTGLTQDAIEPERVVQTLQGGTAPIKGPKGGKFKTRHYWTGHGSSTAGATALDAMETFRGYVFGNPAGVPTVTGVQVSAAAGTTAAAGSTKTNVVTAASGTFARGSLCRIGTSGLSADGRGSGQFYPVASHTGTSLALRHETITAPNATDIVYSAINYWFPELASNSAVKGLRFRYVTPNQQYRMHGCWPMSATIVGTSAGEIAILEVEWGVTWWDSTSSGSFPSTVASNEYNPAPIGGGSMVIGDVGSTVRTAYDVAAFSITLELGIVPLPGNSTADPYARYIGARRTPTKIRFAFTIYAENAGTNTFETKFLAGTSIWFTWTGSAAAGSAFGMHAQNCKIDKRPVQGSTEGLLTVTVEGYCCSGTTDTTSDLSRAALVIAEA